MAWKRRRALNKARTRVVRSIYQGRQNILRVNYGNSHYICLNKKLTTTFRWFGFFLMNVGEIGNFLSYGFAPASVVAPLGAVSLLDCLVVSRHVQNLNIVRPNSKLFLPAAPPP